MYLLFLIIIFLIGTGTAHAYLDPGTGSYLFQIALAVILAGILSLKVFWIKIIGLFKRKVSFKEQNKKSDKK